jgi:phage terminase large subunit
MSNKPLSPTELADLKSRFNVPSTPDPRPSLSKEVPHNPLQDEPTAEQMLAAIEPGKQFYAYTAKDAVDLLFLVDESLQKGTRKLHPWQMETLIFLSKVKCTKQSPLRFLMPAANGSGKDAYINAPIAVFLSLCIIRHRTVITSASHTQLKNQTENYIRSLCARLNKFLAESGICEKAFLIKQQYIVCAMTGSEIILFATDEAGKAEGYHPWPDCPTEELCIIVNEAKTVPEDIFEALSRCTFNRWIEISSPGKTSGHFYNCATSSVMYPAPYVPGQRYCRKITSYDCSHISREKIEADKIDMGETSAVFRSKHLAEFTELDEAVVILHSALEKCLKVANTKINIGLPRRAGGDLAAGGDECTLYIFDNNVQIGSEKFYAEDTEVTADLLVTFFEKWKLEAGNIFLDDGGVGHGIIDKLYAKGWRVNRVLNQSPPLVRSGGYGNRGAELWFRFARLVQECVIVLDKSDTKLHRQLTSRYYKQSEVNGKIILESKKEAKAKGHASPDRADAVVLAFTGVSISDFMGVKPANVTIINKEAEVFQQRDARFEHLNKSANNGKGKISFRNIGNLMHNIYASTK